MSLRFVQKGVATESISRFSVSDLLQRLARVRRLTPFGDCRELGLDGLIADSRVAIGLTLREALQERVCRLREDHEELVDFH